MLAARGGYKPDLRQWAHLQGSPGGQREAIDDFDKQQSSAAVSVRSRLSASHAPALERKLTFANLSELYGVEPERCTLLLEGMANGPARAFASMLARLQRLTASKMTMFGEDCVVSLTVDCRPNLRPIGSLTRLECMWQGAADQAAAKRILQGHQSAILTVVSLMDDNPPAACARFALHGVPPKTAMSDWQATKTALVQMPSEWFEHTSSFHGCQKAWDKAKLMAWRESTSTCDFCYASLHAAFMLVDALILSRGIFSEQASLIGM